MVRIWRAAAILAVGLALAACGSPAVVAEVSAAVETEATPAPVDRAELTDFFRTRFHPDRLAGRSYDDLADVLPNVERPGGTGSYSEAAVLGKIVDVVAGDSYKVGGEGSVKLPFGDPSEMWSTAILHVDVVERLGVGRPVADRIDVVLALRSARDVERIRPGLRSMESVVLLLDSRSAVLAEYPGKYRIIDDGELLVEVVGDELSLPWKEARDASDAAALLAGTSTLSELRRAAERPTAVR